MSSVRATQLSRSIRGRIREMIRLCRGLDEATLSRSPLGRWSPKEIISHLCGPEGQEVVPLFQTIIDEDIPLVMMDPGDPFLTKNRLNMTFSDLFAHFKAEYGRMADFVKGLESFVEAIANHHMVVHIDHMKEILDALGVAGE